MGSEEINDMESSNGSRLGSIKGVLDLVFICFSGTSNFFGYCRRSSGHHKQK